METGKLTIIRARFFNDKMTGKGYKIFIDGKEEGRISYNEPRSFTLAEGEHQVYTKEGWIGSRLLTVNIKANETTEIELGLSHPPTKGRLIFSIFILIFWFGGLFLGRYLGNEILRDIGFGTLYFYIFYNIVILRKKSQMYMMVFGRYNYFYLKEMNH